MLGWDRYGDEWWIGIDQTVCDLASVASATMFLTITGKPEDAVSVVPTLEEFFGKPRLHATVPFSVLPDGIEGFLWLAFQMKDGSSLRFPEIDGGAGGSGMLSVRIYR